MKALVYFLVMASVMIFEGRSVAQKAGRNSSSSLEKPGSSVLLCDWITVHMKTIKGGKEFNHHHRQSAYTGIALYESIVRGDASYRSLSGQLDGYESPELPANSVEICWQASANSALANMFRSFYPQDTADKFRFDSLEKAWAMRLLGEGYSEASVLAGSNYGKSVAEAVMVWCKSDGYDSAAGTYTVPTGMGLWEPTPPKFTPPAFPYMGNMRTMVEGSIDNSIPPDPIAFSADNQSDFYRMVEDVYEISASLDSAQKATGLFWDDFPDGKSVTSGGHWACILKNVMQENQLSLIEGAQAYAEMFIATNDASIGCFKAKYLYNVMRPVTFIRQVMNHPEWNPMINTPSHPEYPAAHATISMAAATILTKLFGDSHSFVDNTYEYRGFKGRHFKNFEEAAREAGMSRFYGGIHYLPSIEAGFIQGKTIADNVYEKLVFRN